MPVARIVTCDVCGDTVEQDLRNRIERHVTIGQNNLDVKILIQITSDIHLCRRHKRVAIERLFRTENVGD
jgi:hypothetical protein